MSSEFEPISLSPQSWKVETDNFFLALNSDDPNKDFPQAIYDRLSVPGRAPNDILSRAFINTVKGIRDGTMAIPKVEKKGISHLNKVESHTTGKNIPITSVSSTSLTHASGLFQSDDQKHGSPEDVKEEDFQLKLNLKRQPHLADNRAQYNGPWNEEYLKMDFVVKNMKELESYPFVQETGSQKAKEAYNLTTEHWKTVNEHFPMAHLHGVAVALYHSHNSVLEQVVRLERNNEVLQSNNDHLLRMIQSLTTRLDELENKTSTRSDEQKKSTATTQNPKRPHWG